MATSTALTATITKSAVRRAATALVTALSLAPGVVSAAVAGHAYRPPDELARLLLSPSRPAAERERDRYRHPLQTLRFFGVRPTDTVVEVWPAPGYYAEILAPYLKDHGRYVAAGFPNDASAADWQKQAMHRFTERFADTGRYGKIEITELGPPDHWHACAPGSADVVLTFRNVHNWIAGGYAQPMFDAFYRALKPGGVLGVVEHRGWPGETLEEIKKTGYVPVSDVKRLAEKAGFRFVAASEINANPRDDHHHPAGVWTLPPTLRLGDEGRAKYLAIGESDRMTLKFVKPRR